MTRRRTLARLLVLGTLIAGGLVATTQPAAAVFHLMKIREVMAAHPSSPSAEFVELQMFSGGQDQVGGHRLRIYDSAGAVDHEIIIPNDVANGVNQATILFATDEALTAFPGLTRDFDMDAGLLEAGGAVCFDDSTEATHIDCVGWGTIPSQPGGGTKFSGGIPSGQSLERTIGPGCSTLLEDQDDTGNSSVDFQLATPSPEPNSATPNETPCAPGTPGGKPVLLGLKAKAKGNRAIISGQIQPPNPGKQVKLTFFANGSPLRKIAKKSATLNAQSKFKKSFRVPTDSTRCKVKVAFQGQAVGQKKFRC